MLCRERYWPARAKVPARGVERRSTTARGPRMGIGFAPEMIADGDDAAHFIQGESPDDRVSDIARAGRTDCHRGLGGMRVSNEFIRFIRRPRHDEDHTDFPVIAFRSAAPDIATDPIGQTACEDAWPTSARDPALLNSEDRTFSTE
jgi:hypothetical protein